MNEKTAGKAVYRATYYDYLLAAVVVVIFAAPLLSFVKAPSNPAKAIVYRNNAVVSELNLSENSVTSVGNMKIEVKDKKIRVLETDCPNQICKHAGWISQPGQSLVCLPNKVVVEIPVDHQNGKYDVISY
jgi:hypothetical protein